MTDAERDLMERQKIERDAAIDGVVVPLFCWIVIAALLTKLAGFW